MSIGTEFLPKQATARSWLDRAASENMSNFRRSYYVAKNADYTSKWVLFSNLSPEKQKNVLEAGKSLTEYCDLNFAVATTNSLYRSAAQGIRWSLSTGQFAQLKIRNLFFSTLNFFSTLFSFVSFGESHGFLTLGSNPSGLRHGMNLVRSASYISYYGDSLLNKAAAIQSGSKKISTDVVLDFFWDVKSITLSLARLFQSRVIPPSVGLALNTLCGWYYFGKAVAQKDEANGLKEAKAQCRILGIKENISS